MADIEKVIKVYECCRNSWRRNCDDCPIKKDCCHDGLPEFAIRYALELLKEQQPVKPEIEGSSNTWWYVCGDCHTSINPNAKYCHQCGHKVMWDSN